MTKASRVLIVIQDSWATRSSELDDDMRLLEHVDRMASELEADGFVRATVVPLSHLPMVEAAAEPGTLFVVFDELGAASAIAGVLGAPVASVEGRLFALAERRRSDAIAFLERSRGPGCVESQRLFVWQTETPEEDPPGGVFGRRDVARAMGAEWHSPALWESENYAMIEHEGFPTLSRLLAAYLQAFSTHGPGEHS